MKDRGGEYRCSKEGQEAIDLGQTEICNPKMLKEVQKRRIWKNDTNDEVDKPLRKEKRVYGTPGWISRKISLDETS